MAFLLNPLLGNGILLPNCCPSAELRHMRCPTSNCCPTVHLLPTALQGVHSIFEGVPDRQWLPEEKRMCKLVFIGVWE